jgi:hypothetical protein
MAHQSIPDAVDTARDGSGDEDHERALRVMSLYAPVVQLATTAEVLAAR